METEMDFKGTQIDILNKRLLQTSQTQQIAEFYNSKLRMRIFQAESGKTSKIEELSATHKREIEALGSQVVQARASNATLGMRISQTYTAGQMQVQELQDKLATLKQNSEDADEKLATAQSSNHCSCACTRCKARTKNS